jgi:hypothetical protein
MGLTWQPCQVAARGKPAGSCCPEGQGLPDCKGEVQARRGSRWSLPQACAHPTTLNEPPYHTIATCRGKPAEGLRRCSCSLYARGNQPATACGAGRSCRQARRGTGSCQQLPAGGNINERSALGWSLTLRSLPPSTGSPVHPRPAASRKAPCPIAPLCSFAMRARPACSLLLACLVLFAGCTSADPIASESGLGGSGGSGGQCWC